LAIGCADVADSFHSSIFTAPNLSALNYPQGCARLWAAEKGEWLPVQTPGVNGSFMAATVRSPLLWQLQIFATARGSYRGFPGLVARRRRRAWHPAEI